MPINFKTILGDSFSLFHPSTWKTVSMVAKVVLVTVTLILGTIIAGGLLAYLVTKSYLENEITFTGRQLVGSLSSSITTLIDKEGGKEELQIAVDNLVSQDTDGRIEDTYILDTSFKILAAKNRKRVGDTYTGPLNLETMTRLTTFIKSDATIVAAPVQWGKTDKTVILGYVVFEFNSSTIDKALNRIILWFALIFLVAVTLASVITWFVLKGLLKPLVNLGQAARAWADGKFDHPIEKSNGHDELAVLTNSFVAMGDAQKVFVRFANPALVQKILNGAAPDKPEKVKLVIGFGDGTKFTNWCLRKSALEISEMLTSLFTISGQIIKFHDGIIDKFIGDAVMTYFGLEAEDDIKYYAQNAIKNKKTIMAHTRNAIRAMICIQHALEIANWSYKKFHSRVPLKFRFGLASGECVIGPIGAEGVKFDYTIIGETVNLASRLEALAAPGGLVIASIAYLDAGEEFLNVKGPTTVNIKGFVDSNNNDKPIDIPIYSVIGLQDTTEDEKLRILIVKLFEHPDILKALKLTSPQVQLLHKEVAKRMSEPLCLPVK